MTVLAIIILRINTYYDSCSAILVHRIILRIKLYIWHKSKHWQKKKPHLKVNAQLLSVVHFINEPETLNQKVLEC